MPNNNSIHGWNSGQFTTTATTTGQPGDAISLEQALNDHYKKKKKPDVGEYLNICGNSNHTKYTIPIGYGQAQCLVCNASTRVDPQYTPGFTKRPMVAELEEPPESEAPEAPNDGDFFDDGHPDNLDDLDEEMDESDNEQP